MAGKRKYDNSTNKQDKWKFLGFRNVELSREEMDTFNSSYAGDVRATFDAIVYLTESGWKTSQSFDTWRDAYCFSVTGKRTNTSGDGYCFTFYHKDLEKAISVGAWYLRQAAENDNLLEPEPMDAFDW